MAHRIIAKAVLSIVAPDVQEATGSPQMCGGQISDIKAAVHATRSAFEMEENEALLLVDAMNAFNALNLGGTTQYCAYLSAYYHHIHKLIQKPHRSAY